MNDRNPETPRSFLAKEVRRIRAAKGMNRAQLANAVFVSESLVRSWERSARLIQPDHTKKVEALISVEPVLALLMRLGEEIVKSDASPAQVARLQEMVDSISSSLGSLEQVQGVLSRLRQDLIKSEPSPEWMGRWTAIEDTASSIQWYQPLVVPGLLQTPAYAREIIANSGRAVSNLEERVTTRMRRQQILDPENALLFVAVMDERVLYDPTGGPEVMGEQLEHLVGMASRPNVYVHIVPLSVGAYSGRAGGFGLATVEGQGFAYVDDAFSGDVLEHPEDVAVMTRIWEALRAHALDQDQSARLIRKALERWTT